jgi:hypothetical protein
MPLRHIIMVLLESGWVAEYLKDTIVLRDYKTTVPSLSERATIIIDGRTYEDLTSGGAADCPMPCPEEYAHSTTKLRFSGHYGWIQKQLIELKINKQNCSLTAKKCKP